MSQCPLQHSPSAAQATSRLVHPTGSTHTWFSHLFVQQSPSRLHAAPFAVQVPASTHVAGVPAHAFEQQSDATAHESPLFRQAGVDDFDLLQPVAVAITMPSHNASAILDARMSASPMVPGRLAEAT